MKITNKYNLPQALVDLIKNSQFGHTEKCYSATTILNPTRFIILNRRHNDEIEIDASQCINQVLGTATHSLIEKFDKTGFAEIYLKEEIRDGYFLTGKCDLYDEVNFALVDYKTANVWKIKFSDFDDWRRQGLIYAWLLIKKGHYVERIRFHALLKDWTAREKRLADMKGEFYPESQVYTYELKITSADLVEIEKFIRDKFDELIEAEKLSDDDLLDCGKKDTWYTGDKFAVYGTNKNKAMRVFDTYEEANDYLNNKGGVEIVARKGEYRRCQDYCECCKFCKYYKERKAV